MEKVTQRVGESRKDYLVRVAITYLREIPLMNEGVLIFDEAECDGFCLADDLETEFDIEMDEQ